MKTAVIKQCLILKEDVSIETISELTKEIFPPGKLSRETMNFAARNLIEIPEEGLTHYTVCARCLKAYLLSCFANHELSSHYFDYINKVFRCPTGHERHYLDNGELKNIEINGGEINAS